jgi:hypothetical protein
MNSGKFKHLPYSALAHSISLLIALLLITGTSVGQAFKHPGIRNTKAELDVIKARVNAGQQPQLAGYQKMLSHSVSNISYAHKPCNHFTFDSCRGRLFNDGGAAYSNALQWYIKDDTQRAEKAITILNDWARIVREFDQSCLAVTWGMPMLINAAEIMRLYPGWKSEDQAKFKSWLSDIVWPFASGCESDRSNWDCGGIALSIEIAVFTDNRSRFESSVERLRNFIPVYVKASGCTNETDRDQGHTQMGLGHLAAACEVAWHQGIDVWSHLDNRLLKGYELNAKYNLGESIGSCSDVGGVSSEFRGNFGHFMWEIAYNHYHNRRGINMPYTKRVFDAPTVKGGKVRPEGFDNDMLPWGTLVHAELGNLNQPIPTPDPELTHTIQLKQNWNLISLPIQPTDDDIADVLAPINGQYAAVHAWNGTTYESYYPGDASSTLKKMPAGRGYWVFMTQAGSLQVKGKAAGKTITLGKDWNLVGYNSQTSMSASQALASTGGKVTAVYSYNSATNSYEAVQTFQPGAGYWMLSSDSSVTWTLP